MQQAHSRRTCRACIWTFPLAAIAIFVPACFGDCPEYTPAVGQPILTPDIFEASGLAASRRTPGFLFTHNDNSNDQRVFAVNANGDLRGTWSIANSTTVRDPEDIAIGPGPIAGETYLYLADIGDNANVRSEVAVYRALEPSVPETGVPIVEDLPADKIRLIYPDGPRDAETLLVDTNGDMYVVAKRVTPGKVYRAPYPQSTTSVNTLELVGQLPWGQTWPVGGDIAADGSAIIIRGYFTIGYWDRPAGADVGSVLSTSGCSVSFLPEQQGEAVCFTNDALDYATLSEGFNQNINWFRRRPALPDLTDLITALLHEADDPATIAQYDIDGDGRFNGLDLAGIIRLILTEG